MAQIKKDTSLRKAILQAAITGQLVSNVEGESLPLAPASKLSSATPSAGASPATSTETGKELLDRIIEERNNKLLADWKEKQTDLFASNDAHSKNAKTVRSEQIRLSKKIKKPEPIVASEIDEDEIPFEIPENWCWCRLGDLAFIARGGSPRPINEYLTNDPDGYNWIKISDTDKGGKYINSTKQKIKKEGLYKTRLIHKGDFLLTNSMSFGRPYISNIEGCIHDGWLVFSFPNKCISPDFIYHLLSSSFIYNQFADSAAGAVVQNLNTDKVIETLIPLPPLSVQNAIVAKLEQVLPLVDAYENALLQKEELKSTLGDKVKKAILQEAITGKLTESWRKSATIKESGKQLLDRIIEERNAKALAEWEETLKKNVGGKATLPSFASKTRAKKPVPVVASEIEEDEIPFEVPESWCWCRLGDLAAIARGGSPRPINDFLTNDPGGYNWIKISDTDKGGKFINSTKQKIKKEGLYKTRLIHKGDFLLTNSMSFGRPYISNIEGCIHDGWLVFSFINELINPDFIYHLLSSPFIYDSFSQSAAGGVVQNLNTDKVIDTLVPLPPLEEQEEIVRKVEELLYIFMNI